MAAVAKRFESELPKGLSVDAFLDWAKDRPGRFELHDGAVFAMAPERVGHARTKYKVQRALDDALTSAMCDCHVVPDGVGVQVSDTKWYEPDALVYCGPDVDDDDLNILDPVVIVEVASPSTVRLDETAKLTGYFAVSSVQHYLIVYAVERHIVHHQRQGNDTILTRIVTNGSLRLDPPGIEIGVEAILD